MNKIGILGSGVVAQSLGRGFIKHGYEVMLGTRNPDQLSDWIEETGNAASAGSVEETASFGDLLVLAVAGRVARTVLEKVEPEDLSSKVIIDATNPIEEAPPVNGVLQYFTGPNESLMEQLQKAFPESSFVKAFSCVGSAFMVNPEFESTPTMFICGNDETAKKDVRSILDQFGWETEDMGAVEAARAIEPLAMLWCIPGFQENRWTHAFKLMKL